MDNNRAMRWEKRDGKNNRYKPPLFGAEKATPRKVTMSSAYNTVEVQTNKTIWKLNDDDYENMIKAAWTGKYFDTIFNTAWGDMYFHITKTSYAGEFIYFPQKLIILFLVSKLLVFKYFSSFSLDDV